MLIFSGSVSPPGIVGNNGDELCTLSDIIAHITAPYRFIANNRCCANAALRVKDGGLVLTPIAAGSSSKGRKKRFEKRKRGREGHPFHTRYEFRFMIKLHPLRIFDQNGRVEAVGKSAALQFARGGGFCRVVQQIALNAGEYVSIFIVIQEILQSVVNSRT